MNITKALNFNRKPQAVNSRNVLQPKHTIPIQISKYYTDIDGVIIAKGAAPAALQVEMPVFLLGEMDRQGGYAVGRKVVPPLPGVYFQSVFVNGSGNSSSGIIGFTGLNQIQNYMAYGDIVIVYTDNLNNPSCYVWIIVKNTAGSIASILDNSKTTQKDNRLGKLVTYRQTMVCSDDTQFSQDLHITRYDNIMNFDDNTVQPLGIYRSIFDRQTNLVALKLTFDITQYIGINFNMLFACDRITIDLDIAKVN